MSVPDLVSSDRTQLNCSDPATGESLGRAAIMDDDAVRDVVCRARSAQPRWAETSFAERRAVLREILEWTVDDQRRICEIAARDSGKIMVDAAMGEVFPVCEKLRYTIAHGERDLRPQSRSAGFLLHKRASVEYRPLGTIAVICPWNFPFHNLLCPIIPALFAGNAVVAKVSEWTSWSSRQYVERIQEILGRRGHSPDLVQIVTGLGETGAHLVRSNVDKVFFTGSALNGRAVMRAASDKLTPVVLELGGKDPLIVCDDANLTQATDAAMMGGFLACGQMCVAAERVYVADRVYDDFVAIVRDRVAALRQGLPLGDEGVDLGATTMPGQLDIVESLVDDAVVKGATVLVGGKRRSGIGTGQFFAPTLLVDVDHSMRITQEECFGPVMVVMRFRDDDHAVQLANDCPFGLGSSVFTASRRRGRKMAERIRSGMTVVNDYGMAYMMQSLPFGGVGESGFGRINGREGLRACCYEKAIVDDRVNLRKSVAVHPIRPSSYDLVEGSVRVLYSRGLRRKARAAADVLLALRQVIKQRETN